MIPSPLGLTLTEFSRKQDETDDCAARGPMSQQDAYDCHGHEMHPQKFVRLVGCHDIGRHEEAHPLH